MRRSYSNFGRNSTFKSIAMIPRKSMRCSSGHGESGGNTKTKSKSMSCKKSRLNTKSVKLIGQMIKRKR